MRVYALYNRSKRIMWFMIICATILSGVACVGLVLDSVRRISRECFQWFTFWNNDALHTLSIGCYDLVTINVYVHLAGSSKSAKVMYISRGIRTCQCPDVVRGTRDQYVVDYAAAWEASFVYDTIIFILTVAETWKWRQGISGERIGLVQLMFRDGRFYSFLVFVGRFIDLLCS